MIFNISPHLPTARRLPESKKSIHLLKILFVLILVVALLGVLRDLVAAARVVHSIPADPCVLYSAIFYFMIHSLTKWLVEY